MNDEKAKELISSVDSLYNAIESLREQLASIENSIDGLPGSMSSDYTGSGDIMDALLTHSCMIEKMKDKGGPALGARRDKAAA